MSLLVTGSIGIDTVKTPFGESVDCVGGSAVYFSMAASLFGPVRFLGVVGGDCPFDLEKVFEGKDVDLHGLEVRNESKTFRWAGTYQDNMNDRTTDNVELNVLGEAPPSVPKVYADSKYVFLANTAPGLQMAMLDQLDSQEFVAADTMNLWIETAGDDFKKLLEKIDMLVLNDEEAKLLTGSQNLIAAANDILKMGPEVVIIKKGEHGSTMCRKGGECFMLPGYPATDVVDPTGAGDSFAGAMMGYLAGVGKIDGASLRNAIVYGTIAASFTIRDFSIDGIKSVSRDDIDKRFEVLREITRF